jgi:hypothetical protein
MRRTLCLGLLLCFFASGCSHGPGIVGKWKIDSPLKGGQSANYQQAGFLTGFGSTFKYEFKPDNTFVGAMTEGTYTLDGGKLIMTTTKAGGQPVPAGASANVMTGELSADGSKLILHSPTLSSLRGMLPVAWQSGVPMVPDKG